MNEVGMELVQAKLVAPKGFDQLTGLAGRFQ